jgi:hypothetical protein
MPLKILEAQLQESKTMNDMPIGGLAFVTAAGNSAKGHLVYKTATKIVDLQDPSRVWETNYAVEVEFVPVGSVFTFEVVDGKEKK